MSTRSLASLVCAGVAAVVLSYGTAGAMPRADAGIARIDRMAAADQLDGGKIVKVAKRGGARAGAHRGGPRMRAHRSIRRGGAAMRGPRSFRRDGGLRAHRSFRRGRGIRSHRPYRGRYHAHRRAPRTHVYRYYTPVVPYFYWDVFPYDYSYEFVVPAGRCERWHRACVANWGYGNSNYYGCMRYHGCAPR